MHHLDDVTERRLLTDRSGEQRLLTAHRQPPEHHPLRRAAERLPSGHTRTDYLHEVAQHLRVIDDTRKDALEQRGIATGKDRAEQRRRILHPAAIAREDGSLR